MAKKVVAEPKMYIPGIVSEEGKFYIRYYDDQPFFNLDSCKEDHWVDEYKEPGDKTVIFELVPVCVGVSETKTTWRNLK